MSSVAAKLFLNALRENLARYEALSEKSVYPVILSLANDLFKANSIPPEPQRLNNDGSIYYNQPKKRARSSEKGQRRGPRRWYRPRQLTRLCAHTIRAIHRSESQPAHELLNEAHQLVKQMKADLLKYPDLYYAGYTQDAIKEFSRPA